MVRVFTKEKVHRRQYGGEAEAGMTQLPVREARSWAGRMELPELSEST